MGRFHDLKGQRFGRLTVIERASDKTTGSKPKVMWRCHCDCGEETIVWASSLVCGTTVSCGCKTRKHGFSHKERLYETWKNMRRRCNDPKNKRYAGVASPSALSGTITQYSASGPCLTDMRMTLPLTALTLMGITARRTAVGLPPTSK